MEDIEKKIVELKENNLILIIALKNSKLETTDFIIMRNEIINMSLFLKKEIEKLIKTKNKLKQNLGNNDSKYFFGLYLITEEKKIENLNKKYLKLDKIDDRIYDKYTKLKFLCENRRKTIEQLISQKNFK